METWGRRAVETLGRWVKGISPRRLAAMAVAVVLWMGTGGMTASRVPPPSRSDFGEIHWYEKECKMHLAFCLHHHSPSPVGQYDLHRQVTSLPEGEDCLPLPLFSGDRIIPIGWLGGHLRHIAQGEPSFRKA